MANQTLAHSPINNDCKQKLIGLVVFVSVNQYFTLRFLSFYSFSYLKNFESVNSTRSRGRYRKPTDSTNHDKCSWCWRKKHQTSFTNVKNVAGGLSTGILLEITLVWMTIQSWGNCWRNVSVWSLRTRWRNMTGVSRFHFFTQLISPVFVGLKLFLIWSSVCYRCCHFSPFLRSNQS